MNERTGLAAEVSTLDLCCDMAMKEVLASAFGNSTFRWVNPHGEWFVDLRPNGDSSGIPAPTCPEMLDYLSRGYDTLKFQHDNGGWRILLSHTHIRENGSDERIEEYLPDALARACIEAAS